MPNPVRAARKEGRKMVKDAKSAVKSYKQSEKAKRVTKKFEDKADARASKLREAQNAARSSEPVSSITSKSATSVGSGKSAELKKATPAALPKAKSSKKATSKKDSSKGSKRSMDKKGSALASVEQAKREKMERALNRKTVESTLAIRDKSKAEAEKKAKMLRSGIIGISAGPIEGIKAAFKKEMGGAAQPSYKKGGYMMSTKKKKK